MTWYVEWRPTVRRRGKIQLVPVDELYRYTGFRSVYAYNNEVYRHILDTNSTKGLHGSTVYSDMLLLDFDDCAPKALEFQGFLERNNINYQRFTSGNRSIHFHVELVEPMMGASVPWQQKRWVQQNAEGADISFYHPSGMYRLTGTYHIKNPGHKKCILDEKTDGIGLKIEIKQTMKIPQISVDLYDEIDYNKILTHLKFKTVDGKK